MPAVLGGSPVRKMDHVPGGALPPGAVAPGCDLLTWALAQKGLLDRAHAAVPAEPYGYVVETPLEATPLLTNCSSFLARVLAGWLGTLEDAIVPAGPGVRPMRLDDRVNIRNEATLPDRNVWGPRRDATELGTLLRANDRGMQGAASALVDLGRATAIADASDIRANTVLQAWRFRVDGGTTRVRGGHAVIATRSVLPDGRVESFGAHEPPSPEEALTIDGATLTILRGESVTVRTLDRYTQVDRVYVGSVPAGLASGTYGVLFGANPV